MNNLDEIKIESKTCLNDQEQEVKIDNMHMSDQDKNKIEIKNKSGLGEKWPEPIVRVQSLAESNLTSLPDRYIKPPSQRPQTTIIDHQPEVADINIPIIDLDSLFSGNEDDKKRISEACREWGFFQVINHGVKPELMDAARETWKSFFNLPVEAKEVYSNSPRTYEGYGSRLGVEKGAILDWNDYYYLHFLPLALKDFNKWPSLPSNIREMNDEYGKELVKLGGRLMTILSSNLGLRAEQLQEAFGGEDVGACLRVNYYPKCPQPELALGLSPHSDPGGMTILLPDDQVVGLQVRHGDTWITVNPLRHAFIVNIGDQIQILSNSKYKSVEHRVIVNSEKERVSLAFFYNPKSDIPIQPMQQLVTSTMPPLYPPMTFDQYRLFIRTQGPRGKSHVESHISPR
ncbi:putative leucoanthocyanidin dioxygenase [Arabidopsis thaliana]|uniref:Jasmonate-induced oxygenase 1 n=2 Tax=Arabidopsis thaliana TaxID=3702 RepID=JOX1_ARATH|nr:2-oxoglutarate (2OG) and Fe(II)-dependent oxygenase superfamily protein [Arabidopsis thaliana]Q9SRM3.1 RecName: Full=Jasmonate-induced oxygenase 1; AltName: Full=2-oxoglutarate-dependent dioxygenase JOX1; AltName: Full=Jasmonic acid oxidase 1 [Arabidopsis thaliana]AAF01507.1 putative leucoanthocyanidin dioxygenase [Arabidopsis thaliana]AAG50980.1 leucoanthocyanidin dioxygenase, putative; 41415-43854 [Arabidopsis thaliana]AEE75010.1 2-oxoglutarate (2OG) and Fe(II)-dependent oxygenase superfam|eukprot:NP_187728.1 2-oxoglutarate (2OG) and Fe(II)-dependent oxygenase superfamily protein [Arabidopsis thaliana]